MPKRILAANWKMHKSLAEAESFIDTFLAELGDNGLKNSSSSVFIFPSFIHIVPLIRKADLTGIQIGAQDCYTKEEGAFTGEVSPTQLRDIGVKAVLVGHSERRHVIGEENALVAEKFKSVIQAGLTAFLCVGETREERQEGLSYSVVEDQLMLPLYNAKGVNEDNLIIAYEPVWAIGTGDNAEPADVAKMVDFIREWLREHLSKEAGEQISILYGGSVRPGILREYLLEGNVNGALVGGASLDPKSFAQLYKETV